MTMLEILINNHPIWHNVFFYLFIAMTIVLFTTVMVMMKRIRKKNDENRLSQQQYTAKIDILRREHSDTLEKIRVEMLKREDERRRQWIESEKETLHVLNGVSLLIDMNIKLGKNEIEKLMKKLEEIREKIEKITPKS